LLISFKKKENVMTKILILLIAGMFVFSSCSKDNSATEKPVDAEKVYAMDDLLSDDFEYKDGKVTIEGLCVHVCAHSGKKMFIVGDDPNNKLQIFTSDAISTFNKEFEGSKLRVSGTLEEEKIDMNYIKEWEAEIAAENAGEKSDEKAACAFEESMKKVDWYKKRIENSKKGYISNYTMTGVEVKQI
jgi:hypothetical protein